MLPRSLAPPIITIRSIRPAMSGARRSASAILVSGPRAQMVSKPGSQPRAIVISCSTACPASAGRPGCGRSAPASPSAPQTNSAVWRGKTSGRSAPANTGTSVLPARSQIRMALAVVFSTPTLPATVVIALTSSWSRAASATRMATASSCPGSVSMTTGTTMSVRLVPAGHDHVAQIVRRQPVDAAVYDLAAALQDGDAGRYLDDVAHVVADEDDRVPVGLQPPDQVENLGGFLDAQCSRGLVHYDDLGVPVQRP